jgi:hypothetical protein
VSLVRRSSYCMLKLTLLSWTVEAHLKAYVEPPSAASATTAAGPSASQLADLDRSLEPGVLTNNLGLGLVFVCTKVRSASAPREDLAELHSIRRRIISTPSNETTSSRRSSTTLSSSACGLSLCGVRCLARLAISTC